VLEILAFLVVIGVLVFVHELGHLLAAKWVGIDVPRFSIGFGPKIAGFTMGGTEYVVSALPLGGYVRMAGMEDTAALEGGADADHQPSENDFDAKSLWARTLVISSGVLMNFLFAIIVFAGVAAIYGEPITATTRVAVVAEDGGEIPPALAGIPIGARLIEVGDRPVETWNEVADALVTAPGGPIDLRFADAPPVRLQLPAGDSARASVLGPLQPFVPPLIGPVSPGGPADRAGILRGDRIIEAGGQRVSTWGEFVQIVRGSPEQELALVVQRADGRIPITLTPQSERELDVEMRRVEIGRIGVERGMEIDREPVGVIAAVGHGATVTWRTTSAIVELLGDLFTGDASPRTLGGPLAIGQLSGQTARLGMEAFFQFMALLSVNLAVLNLLPIPVLDGGQLLFLGVEAVRGKPLSIEQRMRLANVGLIIVVGIMVWAITNDFLRFFGI
jgi:regulator of sigma E protease